MRWLHVFCIGAAALVSACGLGGQYPDFSAKQYRLEGVRTLPGTDRSGAATFYRNGEQLRYEGVLENYGVATIIYDPARKAAYLLRSSAGRRRILAGPPPRPTAVQLNEAEIPQPLEMAWAGLADDAVRALGRCRIAGERGTVWRMREPVGPDGVRTACITPDGIVLKLTENDTVLFQATAVARGPQPNALFEVPESYRIINNNELAAVLRSGG